ncbi:hypothetical protein I4U23_020823 [Adineta vaga]|nr:hypothetical protein I4U23_020823 [Adineta vaga]
MAILGDPTIQRILDEVNKAASGGVLGMAGNYISEPGNGMTQFESQLTSSSDNNFFNQDPSPLFYPTPDMFGIGGLTSFDNNNDLSPLPSVLPMTIPTDFDLYSTGLYNTMSHSYLTPYENYHGVTKLNLKHHLSETSSMRKSTSISTTSNDIIFEINRQQDYTTMPSKKASSPHSNNMNNHITTAPPPPPPPITTSQMTSLPMDLPDHNGVSITAEHIPLDSTDTASLTMNLTADNQDMGSMPTMNMNNNNNETDQQYSNPAGKIFHDPDPQIIQRKGSHSVTYKQNIIVRFLQPPPIPNAGPLIIKEVHAPQPSPLPPLVIKQRPTPPKTPPPLIIREKPPQVPPTLAPKVITRQLPPEPAPPRAVIIERLPPLPSKPRDIIIERWLPYEIINQKRKVVVQRAPKTKQFTQPKNVIITYEPVHANIIRNFQKQAVTREDPQLYLTRYGSQLYDPELVLQQARAVGVVEDLNPPQSFGSTMGATTTVEADYELPSATITVDDDQREHQNMIENNDNNDNDENIKQQHIEEDDIEVMQSSSVIPAHMDDDVQEEDVLVEENVTPFYMNSGEDLQQTLRRLGIELPENLLNEHNF